MRASLVWSIRKPMPRLEATPRRPHSIQRRFLLALAVFLVLSMTLLGTAMLANQRALMQQRLTRDTEDLTQSLQDKGTAASNFLARIAPQGLLAYDYLLLEGYVEELSADPDIVYAVIFDTAGKPVTHYLNAQEPYFAGQPIRPDNYSAVLDRARTDNTLLKVQRDIDYDGARLGRVEVALSRAKILQRAQELQTHLHAELTRIALITGGLLLVSLVALILLIEWTFRRLVVKPVQALAASMARVQAGDLDARAEVARDDEIGYLTQRFNRMTDDLQDQLAEIAEHARTVQATRDYLASILDHSADMIATTAIDGTVVEFNRAAEHILGYPRDAVVGNQADAIYCDLALRDRLYATVHAGQPVQAAETQLQRQDGSRVDVELTMSPLRDTQGELIGAVCIGRDVTHAKALRRELIQAEKLASVGQVAAWITHQIRNYLGRMLMSVGTLRPNEHADSAQQKAHADLTRSIADLDRLVTDLLDYSRSLTLHPTPMRLNAALNDLLKQLEAELPSSATRIEREFLPDLPPINVDVFKIEQALSNVLRNAVQAMPQGGVLRVSTRVEHGNVIARIQDSGPGIQGDDLDAVFRPFYTTKPSGTGLGLALAQRIVEAHGGRITAANALNGGAVFEIVLPCVEAVGSS
ncbi:MAG: PAS domain S-box protein [Gammaproteobacteria bacterium]|nr:PAS domain S-box protein [Gammaproteobacteria bacterium]